MKVVKTKKIFLIKNNDIVNIPKIFVNQCWKNYF